MKKTITTLFIACFAMVSLHAQIYYINPSAPGNPGGLNNDPESPVGSGLPASWTSILSGGNFSPTWSTIQTLPFAFDYDGTPVTQFKVSSSGVLTFDVNTSLSAPSYTNAILPNSGIPNKSILVWGLRGTGNNDAIATKVFGTAPNRQFWVFFASFSFLNSGNSDYAYYSIVLEEGTNHMFIVDQRKKGSVNLTLGTQVNGAVAYSVPGSPNVPGMAGQSGNSSDNIYYSIYPGPQPALDAAGHEVLLASPIALASAPYTLQAKFGNYGTSIISSASINYRINGGSTVSAPLSGLNFIGNTTTTLTHPTTWNPGLGTYTVEMWLSNVNGSTDAIASNDKVTKEIVVSNNVGIEDLSALNNVVMYPNPTHGKTILALEGGLTEEMELAIVNITGQVVYSSKAQLAGGKNEITLPTEELIPGLYFVKMTINGKSKVLKLNKQ